MASPTRRTSTLRAQARPTQAPPHTMHTPARTNAAYAPTPRPKASAQNNHDKQDKQAEIFAAALRLFQAHGYHGTSMQDLADAVGMQKASLYYYFDSKEELLVRVCERGTGAFTQELEDIVASDLNAVEKLRRAMECHLVALCEQLDLFTVFLREQKFLGETEKKRLRGEGKRHAELLAVILQQGISSGEFREVNVTVTTLAILGMSNWLYEWYSPEGPLTPGEIASTLSDLVLNGLAPDVRKQKKGKR